MHWKYTISIHRIGRKNKFTESLRSYVGVCSQLVLRAGKLECVPVITGGREELAYSNARVYVVRRVARHKKKAFALIPGVALNEVVDLLERAYTYPRGRENTQEPREIWLDMEREKEKESERSARRCGFCSWNSKARIHTWAKQQWDDPAGITRSDEAEARGIVVTAFPVLWYPAHGLTIARLARRFGGDRVGKLRATVSGIRGSAYQNLNCRNSPRTVSRLR